MNGQSTTFVEDCKEIINRILQGILHSFRWCRTTSIPGQIRPDSFCLRISMDETSGKILAWIIGLLATEIKGFYYSAPLPRQPLWNKELTGRGLNYPDVGQLSQWLSSDFHVLHSEEEEIALNFPISYMDDVTSPKATELPLPEVASGLAACKKISAYATPGCSHNW